MVPLKARLYRRRSGFARYKIMVRMTLSLLPATTTQNDGYFKPFDLDEASILIMSAVLIAMKALARKLRPPDTRFHRCLHLEAVHTVAQAPSHQPYKSNTPRKQLPPTVASHLVKKRPAAALVEFRRLLERCEAPDILEKHIGQFERYEHYEHMKKALAEYLDYGYMPSSELWSRMLQAAGLAVNVSTDIAPYFKHGLLAAVNDEATFLSLLRYTSRYGLIEVGEELFLRYRERLKVQAADVHAEPAPKLWAALIDGRARASDLDEALAWFMRWRTSPNHPCPTSDEAHAMVDGHQDYEQRIQSIASAQATMRMREAFAPLESGAAEVDTADDLASTSCQQRQKPDPAPYLALLKALVRPGSMEAERLVELMAADGVPLTTATMNGLLDSELRRQEKGQLASVLSLYERMRTNPDPAYRPDHITFQTIFMTYREPRQVSSISNPPPQPTRLARKAELPPPPEEYLHSPRSLFMDVCAEHFRQSQVFGDGTFITAQLLDAAVGAFVRTRDFVGCAAALSIFSILRIEPTIKTHAIVTNGLLRARARREAFSGSEQQYVMSDEEASRLRRHVKHLNDLVGSERPIVVRTERLESASHTANAPALFAVRSNLSEVHSNNAHFDALTWNDRVVPRTEFELRNTRRYELRNLAPLKELLRRASGMWEQKWKKSTEDLHRIFARLLRGEDQQA